MKCFGFSRRERKGEVKWVKSAPASTQCNVSGSSEYGLNSRSTSDTSMDSSGRSRFSSCWQMPSTNLRVFTFSELRGATKSFSRSLVLGEGGFGCVYRGTIRSVEDPNLKLEVAVKQLNRKGFQGHKEWMTEVNVLGIVEHSNLVKLLGYCSEEDGRGIQRLLVYEFMHNGSVEDHLYSRAATPLPWSTRLRIALDAARGLTYLHEGLDFQIIFRDLKTSNILLDEQWNAKLSDFGLAREGPTEGLSHVSTAVVGTLGYAAPEYMRTGHLTTKSDIWSFGVVLYELITGRRPIDRSLPKSEQRLLEWIKPYISDSKKFHMIIDPRLNGQYSLNIARKLSFVATRCLVRQPKARPKMSEVLEMVTRIVEGAETGNPQGGLHISVNDDESKCSNDFQCSKKVLNARTIDNERPALRIWTPRLIWTC